MITSLKLRQFRNHNNLELDFYDPLVVITGQNAIGKTNILEAIYVSSLTKSFRVSDYKLVSRGKDFFTIDRVQDDQNIHVRLTLSGSSKNKQIRLNKSNITQLSFIGKFPVTLVISKLPLKSDIGCVSKFIVFHVPVVGKLPIPVSYLIKCQ